MPKRPKPPKGGWEDLPDSSPEEIQRKLKDLEASRAKPEPQPPADPPPDPGRIKQWDPKKDWTWSDWPPPPPAEPPPSPPPSPPDPVPPAPVAPAPAPPPTVSLPPDPQVVPGLEAEAQSMSKTLVATLIAFGAIWLPGVNALASTPWNPGSPPIPVQAQAGFVDPAPNLSLPAPSEAPPPVAEAPPVIDPVPADGGSVGFDPGAGAPPPNNPAPGANPGGGGQPPPGCTPSAPYNISSSAGTPAGASNGNGGSWTISNPGATDVTITDQGMTACNGLHHSMHVRGDNPDGYTVQCNPTTGSTVQVTVSTSAIKGSSKPFTTISVTVTYDSGC